MMTTLRNERLIIDDFYFILAKAARDGIDLVKSDIDLISKEITTDNSKTRMYLQRNFGFNVTK